jgi:hypothetical protein
VAFWLASIALVIPEAAAPRAVPPQNPAAGPPHAAPPREVLDRYCVGCHNTRLQTAALALDPFDVSDVAAHAEVWEKVVRKSRTRVMPPLGAPRPDETTYQALVEALETSLDRHAATHPYPGAPVIHRLNRAEYANAIRDLLSLDVDIASLLPADDSAYGFDNVSDVLNVSPSLQERYLSAARKVSALAIGDSRMTPFESTYRVRQDRSQNQHVEGLPLGTIGGTLVRRVHLQSGPCQGQARHHRHVREYGEVRHTIAARDGSWTTGPIRPGESATVTVTKPGEYEYVCSDHLWSMGQLIVE